MEKTYEILSKRILFLSKIIMTLVVISSIIFIDFLDLQENNNNRTYLNTLKEVALKDANSELFFEKYELQRMDTLKNKSSNIYATHLICRNNIVTILKRYGAIITSESKGSNSSPNIIILMTNGSLKKEIQKTPVNFIYRRISQARSDENLQDLTISGSIDIFNKYQLVEEVELISEIDTNLLKRKCDSILDVKISESSEKIDSLNESRKLKEPLKNGMNQVFNDNNNESGSGGGAEQIETNFNILFKKYQTFVGIYIYREDLIVSIYNKFVKDINQIYWIDKQKGGQGGSGKTDCYIIKIPIKTLKIQFPSTLEYAGFDKSIIQTLSKNKNKQKEISKIYGFARLNMIDDISKEIYKRNSEPISVLGFYISRKWFPVIIFILLLFISFMIHDYIKKINITSKLIHEDNKMEDVLSFLIENKIVRFLIWVIAPGLILIFILYTAIIYFSSIIYLILTLFLASTILGLISFIKSLK